MKWVLSKFNKSLLALNHLLKDSNSIYIILNIINNRTGKDNWFKFSIIVFGKSFMYRRKTKGPKIDPSGTPCFTTPQSEYVLLDFLSPLFDIYLYSMI
jgi:hypothetical protein